MELHTAITQTGRHESVSDKYETISTELIIKSLEARGFALENTQVSRVRKLSNEGFQKHLVTMTYESLRTAEGVPTVLIQNSHNKSAGLKFHTGFIRFACMNGLIIGDEVEAKSIMHYASWKDKATEFLDNYMNTVARMEREHQRMESQYLDSSRIYLLANEAAKLRYDIKDVLDPMELALVRRPEDRGNTAWKIYNRIQEGLIHGLFQRRVKNVDKETGDVTYSDWGKANKLAAQDEIIRVNKGIRELVMEVC